MFFFLRPFFCVCVCQKRRGSNRFFTFLVATDRDVFKAKDFWLFFHFYLCFFFLWVVSLIYDDDQDVKGGWGLKVGGV